MKETEIIKRNKKASNNGRKGEIIAERILRVHVDRNSVIDIPDENCEIGEVKACQEYINKSKRFGRITLEEKQREALLRENKKLLVVVLSSTGNYIFSVKPEDIPKNRQISWIRLYNIADTHYKA